MPNNYNTDRLAIPSSLFDNWQTLVNLAANYLSVPTVIIIQTQEAARGAVCFSSTTAPPTRLQSFMDSSLDNPLLNKIIRTGQPLWITNMAEDSEFSAFYQSSTIMSYAGLPLYLPTGELYGVLNAIDFKEHQYAEREFQLFENFKLSIESNLTNIHQQSEINRLNRRIENTRYCHSENCSDLTQILHQEIDKRKLIERQLQYHKSYDPGTGFLNRLALEVELKDRLSAPGNMQLAVIHISFSNARLLQNRYGYQQWEEVLKRYRTQLDLPALSNTDILTARPNSTDIALIVQSETLIHDVDLICEKLTKLDKSLSNINHQYIYLHTFIGISTSVEGKTVPALLEQALTATISSKESGNLYCYYSEALVKSQSRIHQLENYLLQAVRNGDLMLYFQPKVSLKTKRWIGAEALLRWRHPVLEDISSETLIHLAEKNGLIYEVGNFVLKKAIEKASQWSKYTSAFKVAVNISAHQLRDVRFVDQVKHFLSQYNLPANYLEIEITESGLIKDEKVAREILQVLHKQGITLSLDDFGTGYASFNYLKKYPFDCIKIDKSFIHSLEHNEDDKEIIRSIVQVAKKLKLEVIIEGIETEAQEAFAIVEACDYGQGFLYGHPMPADDFEMHLRHQQLHIQTAN
jgi:EAL domain-containing protein (putative c-di-GMP-specific phosphodiesterase class I)